MPWQQTAEEFEQNMLQFAKWRRTGRCNDDATHGQFCRLRMISQLTRLVVGYKVCAGGTVFRRGISCGIANCRPSGSPSGLTDERLDFSLCRRQRNLSSCDNCSRCPLCELDRYDADCDLVISAGAASALGAWIGIQTNLLQILVQIWSVDVPWFSQKLLTTR